MSLKIFLKIAKYNLFTLQAIKAIQKIHLIYFFKAKVKISSQANNEANKIIKTKKTYNYQLTKFPLRIILKGKKVFSLGVKVSKSFSFKDNKQSLDNRSTITNLKTNYEEF